jgi:hypothetical protein
MVRRGMEKRRIVKMNRRMRRLRWRRMRRGQRRGG